MGTRFELAAQLCLSEQTVKGYVSTLLRKPKLSRRAEAAAFISRRSMGAETPAAGPRGNGEQIRRSAG